MFRIRTGEVRYYKGDKIVRNECVGWAEEEVVYNLLVQRNNGSWAIFVSASRDIDLITVKK